MKIRGIEYPNLKVPKKIKESLRKDIKEIVRLKKIIDAQKLNDGEKKNG